LKTVCRGHGLLLGSEAPGRKAKLEQKKIPQ